MSLEVVFGPMFSGKTTYALSYIRRQQSIGKNVLVIKPTIDSRYTLNSEIASHDLQKLQAVAWDPSVELYVLGNIHTYDCVVLEEAQFFKGLHDYVYKLIKIGKQILIVGLDGDASQKMFGEILECIPLATHVTKLNALCKVCADGTLAPFTKKLVHTSGPVIDVGGSEKYASVCLRHL
jgi:thymidine kinase